MDNLETFIKRLERLGIAVKLVSNYPWVYIYEINGKKVKETFMSKHGFTAFWRVRENFKVTNIKEIFKLIRKYK